MIKLKDLIDKSFNILLDIGLSYKTVYSANWYIWNRLTKIHGENIIFEEWMVFEYCEDLFKKDIFTLPKNKLLPIERRYRIAFNNLLDIYNGNQLKKVNYHYMRDLELSNNCQMILDDYILYSEEKGNSKRTIKNKEERIKHFLVYSDFDNITTTKIEDYLKERRRSLSNVSYTIDMNLIHQFLIFCFNKNIISKEILRSWPDKIKGQIGKKIPSAFTLEEIELLLKSSKAYTREDNHLRNYAILCLVAYTGIRASDVTNLKVSDIDWNNNLIKFVQQKTSKEHIIPLIPEIGNPIVNYIINERPKSKANYLFLSEKGEKIKTSQQITSIINTYFSNSPINLNGRHFGAHSLRHSIATNLINNNVPIFNVANVLGHSNTTSVTIYAKLNLDGLRKCILEAPYEKRIH